MALSLTVLTPYKMLFTASGSAEGMTPSQMISSLNRFLSKAGDYNKKAQAMLKQATKKKNVMLSSCLEPKAKDLAFWTKELSSTVNEFKTAQKTESPERLSFIYQKGVTISGKVENLFIQATQCVGDEHFIAASSGKGVNLQVIGPDHILNPEEPLKVGTTHDSMDDPNIDGDMSSSSDSPLETPDVSDWAGDIVWPEATQFE